MQDLSGQRKTKLGDSTQYYQFEREADETKSWLEEKMKIATDESYKVNQVDPKVNFYCLLQKRHPLQIGLNQSPRLPQNPFEPRSVIRKVKVDGKRFFKNARIVDFIHKRNSKIPLQNALLVILDLFLAVKDCPLWVPDNFRGNKN